MFHRYDFFDPNIHENNSMLYLQGNSGNFIKFRKGNLNYTGPVDLTQYYIESYEILDDDEFTMASTNGKAGVYIRIILGRRLLNQILTNFLPCIFICIVVFSTNYFKVTVSFIMKSSCP